MVEPKTVVCRVNPKSRSITVFEDTENGRVEKEYRSVSGVNAEFGNGLIRMQMVEGWEYSAFDRPPRGFDRAYYNPKRYTRYVNRETGKAITKSRAVVLDCSSVYYLGDK